MVKDIGRCWFVVAAGAVMLLAVAAACGTETIEVPGETVVVEKEVIKEVQVPGETVVVEKEVVKTVEVPGETVTKEVVKEVQVPGETVVVEKEVVKTVEVPGQTVVVEKEVVKEVEAERYVRNVWGEPVEKPQYGGTLPMPANTFPENFDPPLAEVGGNFWRGLVFDQMGQLDWTLPRDDFPALISGLLTVDVMTGELAESWEVTSDLRTYTFHLRKGVQWHDKAPMNGRELTAHDAEFTWNMHFGLGEFAERGINDRFFKFTAVPMEAVTATDNYTLVVKSQTPSLDTLETLLGMEEGVEGSVILPREVYEEYGDMSDWRNVVGSGPYEITDSVLGSSFTLTKNPNYWKYDSLFPDLELRLPYVDEIKMFFMPELSTQLAAFRTGKIAMPNSFQLTIEQVESVQRTNPEVVAKSLGAGTQMTTPAFRVERPPFDNKNVRIAMQKAINLDEINYAYYKGSADTTPKGYAYVGLVGKSGLYAEWPEEVKWQYEYDPAEAERLLDEAGYARGGDGIRFKVGWDVVELWGHDLDLIQVLTSYFDKIGVAITVNALTDDSQVWNSYGEGTSAEIVQAFGRNYTYPVLGGLSLRHYGDPSWTTGITDVEFNALYEKAQSTIDREEFISLVGELDQYYIKEMWTLALPIPSSIMLYQPWLKGYRGEKGSGSEGVASSGILERVWVDQELKEDMGH